MKKNIIIALLIGLVVGGGSLALVPKATPAPVAPVGALSGPDIPSQYLRWGGVVIHNQAMSLAQATNTVCALQSPSSTSTLLTGAVRFTVSSTTASQVEIAKATTAFATTTLLGTKTGIEAGAQITIVASSTQGQAAQANIFAPNTWFVIKMQGGVSHVMSPEGSCSASWLVI